MRFFPRVASAGLAALLVTSVAAAGCSKENGSKAAFCQQVKTVPALSGVLSGFDRADAEELTRRLDGARRAYGELTTAAPAAIEDDTAALVRLVDDVLDAVQDHPKNPSAVASTLRRNVADHPDATASSAVVSAYADKECRVRLDPLVSESTTTTASAASSPTSGG